MTINTFSLEDRSVRVFIVLLTAHSALLVASNAAGSKIIQLPWGLAASATVVSYIASILILDSIAELYGKHFSRMVINVGLGAIILSVLFFQLVLVLPSASFWHHQGAFDSVLGSTPRILLGGWVAYMVGQNLDLSTFLMIKATRFGANKLWFRTWASTAISQLIDSAIFMTIAFAGEIPLIPAIAGQYAVKILIMTISTPFIYVAVGWSRKYIAKNIAA